MTKWPKRVKHRKKVLAKIYRPCAGRGSYRVAWTVAGKRMMKSFPTYSGEGGALEYAEELVKDLAKGSQVTALTPGQARDALAAFERLQGFYVSTGRRVSLLAGRRIARLKWEFSSLLPQRAYSDDSYSAATDFLPTTGIPPDTGYLTD